MLKKYIDNFNKLIENKYIKYIFICLLFFLILFFIQNYDISLWADEFFSIENTKKTFSFFDVIKYSSILDTWPPLFYILLHYYQILLGNSELALRILTFIFNFITLFIIYFFTKTLYSKKEALLTCILFTFSPYILTYSIEIRGYSLFLLLSTLSLYLLCLFIKKQQKNHLYLFLFFSLLNSFTHYFGLLLSLLQIIYILFENFELFKQNKRIILLFLLLLIIYPSIHFNSLYFKYDFFNHNAIFADTSVNKTTFIINKLLPTILFNFTNIKVSIIITLLLIIFSLYNRKKQNNKFILFFIILPLLSVNMFSFFFMAFLHVRYFIFVFPLVYILISHFIVTISKQYFYIVIIIFLFILCINITNINIEKISNYDKDNVLLLKNFSKDKIIVLHSKLYFINYYLDRYHIKNYPIDNIEPKNFKIDEIIDLTNNYKYIFIVYPFFTKQNNKLFKDHFRIIEITPKLYALLKS